MNLSVVDALPFHLPDLKLLWRRNSKTLGFFPAGAFDEAVSKRRVLVATEANNVAGYLLFRQSHGRITIVHLCVHEAYQRRGVARELVNGLSQRTQAASGIELKCRTDFEVNTMWPRLGFIARTERQGRSSKGLPLTCWWKGNGGPSLESLLIEETLAGKIAVALDANVFFDLEETVETTKNEEARSLLADWLQDSIELCLTPEIFNEIHRKDDPHLRECARTATSRYTILQPEPQPVEASLTQLAPLFPLPTRESDHSDLRQIANASGAKVPFFVTRDSGVLEREDVILEATGVRVLRPATLIAHLDELRREIEYRPVQFASTDLGCRRVGQQDVNGNEEWFQRPAQGEGKASFKSRSNRLLSHPNEVDSLLVFDDALGHLGIFFTSGEGDVLDVPLIRAREIASSPSSAPTIARSLSSRLVKTAVEDGRRLILISDPYVSPMVERAFLEDGFFRSARGLLRFVLPLGGSTRELTDFAEETRKGNPWLSLGDETGVTRLLSESLVRDPEQAALAEDLLWPTRIFDASLATYIVPIKTHWAKELFDENLAAQTIFGSLTRLLLNRESVYYRSSKPGGIKAPARILWYVSQDARFENAGSIRACSSLQEVHIGSAKTLFSQFRRLGVFEWKDLMNRTQGDPHRQLMALKFGSTFLFPHSVPWATFQGVLAKHECKGPIVSPHRIKNEVFIEIFSAGV